MGREKIMPLLDMLRKDRHATDEGVTYLEVKQQLLLSYCINAIYFMLLKADGSISVKNHPVMKQLFQLRTIMEKIRPLDKRLQHQMDRLVNTDPIDEDGEGVTDMDEETEDHVN